MSFQSFINLHYYLAKIKEKIDDLNIILENGLMQMEVMMCINKITGKECWLQYPKKISKIPDEIYDKEIDFNYTFGHQLKSSEKDEVFTKVIVLLICYYSLF